MDSEKYLGQLAEIQRLMQQSSKFISLSGLSGVLAGTYALLGAWGFHLLLPYYEHPIRWNSSAFILTLVLALTVIVLSLVTGMVFSLRKAAKRGEKVWNATSKKFLASCLIPLVAGGAFALILVFKGYYGLVAPITLLFYGVALVSASRYSFETLRNLGLIFIVLGLANAVYINYGLYFWSAGFGVSHIVYGIYMYVKYDRTTA